MSGGMLLRWMFVMVSILLWFSVCIVMGISVLIGVKSMVVLSGLGGLLNVLFVDVVFNDRVNCCVVIE